MKKLASILLAVWVLGMLCAGCSADRETFREDSGSVSSADTAADAEKMTGTSVDDEVSESPADVSSKTPEVSLSEEELAARTVKYIFSQPLVNSSTTLPIDWISQYPELPTGCESIALTSALNYWGCQLGVTDIADQYLICGNSFVTSFAGDPHEWDGAGTYPPGLILTTRNYTEQNPEHAQLEPVDLTGTSFHNLLKLIERGCPVIVWGTLRMEHPKIDEEIFEEYNGIRYPWYENEHCMLIIGYDLKQGTVTVNDSIYGQLDRDLELFAEIYEEIGSFSMVVYNRSKPLTLLNDPAQQTSQSQSSTTSQPSQTSKPQSSRSQSPAG